MTILIMTVGLPRSGKTTWAKEQGKPIVNRDAIRLALHGQPYVPEAEDMVTVIEKIMVESLFKAGHESVILDATNLNAERRKQWEWRCDKIVYKEFKETELVCIARAVETGKDELIPVIERMNRNAEWPE